MLKQRFLDRRAAAFFIAMMMVLTLFEAISYYMTQFGLTDILFIPVWPQLLACLMCLADFVIVTVLIVNSDGEPREYLSLAIPYLLLVLAQGMIMWWTMLVWGIYWDGPREHDQLNAILSAAGYSIGRVVLVYSTALAAQRRG